MSTLRSRRAWCTGSESPLGKACLDTVGPENNNWAGIWTIRSCIQPQETQ